MLSFQYAKFYPFVLYLLGELLKATLDGRQDIDKLHENEVLKEITLSISKKKESLKSDPNSRLWLQYMDAIDMLRSNIRADRTGSF